MSASNTDFSFVLEIEMETDFTIIVMDSLQFLVHKGLITEDYRPVPPIEPVKAVNNGVIFQAYCHNGLRYDIAVSWLQKAIRRGHLMEALYCCYHISELGKIFRSHLLNRLITILSEDIGAAEPEIVTDIASKYFDAISANNSGCVDDVHDSILYIVPILAAARKSRMTDLLLHIIEKVNIEDPDFEIMEERDLISWAHKKCMDRTKKPCTIKYWYNGLYKTLSKDLEVYNLWKYLLDTADRNYDDTAALLEIFIERGVQYGLLFITHAILLFYRKNRKKKIITEDITVPDWDSLAELDFPIRNSAIDMHTRYGRKYLGRNFYDFLTYGSKLSNWSPMEGEKEIIETLIDINKPRVDISTPRNYQEMLIDKSVKFLQTYTKGWLVMACGTGKTKTSYWIKNEILKDQDSYIVVVVTPFLEILKQFFQSWSAMNRTKIDLDSITGIFASCRDTFSKDNTSNYEYFTLDTMDTFMAYPYKKKYIFTTYNSVSKLIDIITPNMVIYDEAHHIKKHKVFKEGYQLYLTATPGNDTMHFGDVIDIYHLNEAISDGVLTDYRVHIFVEYVDMDGILQYITERHTKTIVYSNKNTRAKELYDNWQQYSSCDNAFYVDCHTGQTERKIIFDKYKSLDTAIIFNCAILGEGIDFTDCDSIFIESGYVSHKTITQAVGRPLRQHPGKTLAHIYMTGDGREQDRLKGIMYYDPTVKQKVDYI